MLKLKVKDMDIATGDIAVVVLNEKDAKRLDLHSQDRVLVKKGKKQAIAALDIAESAKAVRSGGIGLYEEVLDKLNAKKGDVVEIQLAPKPRSYSYIKRKLDGHELTKQETLEIVKDIVNDNLTEIELTTYVIANYTQGMSMKEVANLTHSMKETGDVLKINKYPVIDLHCIGGVAGNRTTIIVVPILLAAGCIVPKTSSRAITSPSGTADTMETICSVNLTMKELRKAIKTAGGFVTWGGAINLAPADEKIITVEHPLSIDAEGQMLASIMAKKASVSATHLLMDIPTGKGSKVENPKMAKRLKKRFEELGKLLKMKTKVIFTDGTNPVGNGIGAALEMRDCIWLLHNDPRGPKDLEKRSIHMAGIILEFVRKAKKGKGKEYARKLLKSGKAWTAFKKMIKAQKGKIVHPEDIPVGKITYHIKAHKKGTLIELSNKTIAKTARLAGAPRDTGAGIYIHHHKGDKIEKGEIIYTIHAQNELELEYAIKYAKDNKGGIKIKNQKKHLKKLL